MINNDIKLDILFKQLNERVSSTTTKNFFEEARVNKKMIDSQRIATDASLIPSIPSIIPNLIDFYDGQLTEDNTVSEKKSWYINNKSDFISPAYGTGYEIKLYDNDGSGAKGSRIFPTDPSNWFFFYESGQLTFYGDNSSHNASSGSLNYYVEVYQYIGDFGISGGGLTATIDVNQISHGFSIGQLIYRKSDSTYGLAIADSLHDEMSDVVGLVIDVIDANNFIYQYLVGEYVKGTGTFPVGSVGDAVFLSNSTAGEMTTTAPSSIGDISKPIGIIINSNSKMILFHMRGIIITNTSTPSIGDKSYDYYVTENDFNDLKTALSNSSYQSIYIPNGTYDAPNSLSGNSALSINDDNKLLHGESENGVIISLSNVPSNILYGISINADDVMIENVTIDDFSQGVASDIVAINRVSGNFSLSRVSISNITNTGLGDGVGIKKTTHSSHVTVKNTDLAIDLSNYCEDIYVMNCGKAIQGSSYISVYSFSGITGIAINNSRYISNGKIDASSSALIIDNSNNIENVIINNISTSSKLINDSYLLNNIYIIEVGLLYNNVIFFDDSHGISNIHISGGNCENMFRSCSNISNIIITDGSMMSTNIETSMFNYCNNIQNVMINENNGIAMVYEGCEDISNSYIKGSVSSVVFHSSNRISNIFILDALGNDAGVDYATGFYDSKNIDNIEIYLAKNHSGRIGFVECENVSNVITDNYGAAPNYLDKLFLDSTNLVSITANNVVGNVFVGSNKIKNVVITSSGTNGIKGFDYCDYLSNCDVSGMQKNAYINCNNLTNCKGKNNWLSLSADDLTKAEFENTNMISNCIAIRTSSMSYSISGFRNSKVISNCIAGGLTETNSKLGIGFNTCENISSSIVSGVNSSDGAMKNCLMISSSIITLTQDIADIVAYEGCSQISASRGMSGLTTGSEKLCIFSNCNGISACHSVVGRGGDKHYVSSDYVVACFVSGGASPVVTHKAACNF